MGTRKATSEVVAFLLPEKRKKNTRTIKGGEERTRFFKKILQHIYQAFSIVNSLTKKTKRI